MMKRPATDKPDQDPGPATRSDEAAYPSTTSAVWHEKDVRSDLKRRTSRPSSASATLHNGDANGHTSSHRESNGVMGANKADSDPLLPPPMSEPRPDAAHANGLDGRIGALCDVELPASTTTADRQQNFPESKLDSGSSVADAGLSRGPLRTGLVFYGASRHVNARRPRHPEREDRITAVREALHQAGLLHQCRILLHDQHETDDPLESEGVVVAAPTAPTTVRLTDENFARVHLPGYLQRLSRLSSMKSEDDLHREAGQYTSLYLTRDSYTEARNASQALCELVHRVVVTGECHNGFAAIRPPGHHATPGQAGGYCILNNVAVSAAYARTLHPVNRVLIVDWDVHHGNGTQAIFFHDPAVLCVSVHRWHGGQYYPFDSLGGPTTVGLCHTSGDDHPPRSSTVNVGWTRSGMGDAEYRAVWQLVVLPLVLEFRPDLVLVSAGFDAADGDSGGGGDCCVSPAFFGDLTMQLRRYAPYGRLVAALEGGYALGVLGRCATSVVQALVADDADPGGGEGEGNIVNRTFEPWTLPTTVADADEILSSIDPVAAQNIRATMDSHRPYWKCLQRI